MPSIASNREDDEQHLEFRNMVKAFHQAGIGVVLDVVYNHTCEGDHRGPDLQLQGIRRRQDITCCLRIRLTPTPITRAREIR